MILKYFLIGFGASFTISALAIFILIIVSEKRNKNKFKCDICGGKYSERDNKQHIIGDELMCNSCYWAMKAPYKFERRDSK